MARPKKKPPNRSDGRWEYKQPYMDYETGQKKRKTFYSRDSYDGAMQQGKDWLAKYKFEHTTGFRVGDAEPTNFQLWAEKWLESKKGTVRDNSYDSTYVTPTNGHIIPHFGTRSIATITPFDVQRFFAVKGETCSLSFLQKMKICMNGIFETAITAQITQTNPCKHVVLNSKKKPAEKRVYTQEQFDYVMDYARGHTNGLPILLMGLYGLRRSELLGLMRKDIDYEAKTMHIQRGVTNTKDSETGKYITKVDDTKTVWSDRVVPISDEIVKMLKSAPKNSDFVFHTSTGNCYSPRTWSTQIYKRFMTSMQHHYKREDIEVPALNPHELRHTRATIWVNEGRNLYAIAEVLGWDDLKMLRQIYAHSDVNSTRKMLSL